jgi:hypothetical protein
LPALQALKNVQIGKLSNDIEIYEDWAFRVGEYGNLDAGQSIEISIREQYFMSDPGIGVMANSLNANEVDVQLIKPTDFIKNQIILPMIFLRRIVFNIGKTVFAVLVM